ncbi:helix-turn-helix transcriptional regulator [Amycolatopsis sp. NPDC059021]|uniref:helix-turn-helix transcriptional regulator n=1 Tax=Amycolatopsis sp. NPDC059021 TaxID=3346704 RepID=UPI00366FAA52
MIISTLIRERNGTPDPRAGRGAAGEAGRAAAEIRSLLAERRIAKGWSQCDLAHELFTLSGNGSVTREDVSRWERGKRIPGPYWRHWLSDVLDMPCHDLDAAASVAREHRRARRD